MNKFLALFNYRTVIIIIVACVSCWLTIYFQIRIHYHLILYSLLVAFPMVFSLQSAFKRREKALEYMSQFTGSMQLIWQCLLLSKKITPEVATASKTKLIKTADTVLDHLKSDHTSMEDVYRQMHELHEFMRANRSEIGGRILLRISRYMNNVYESVVYLESQKTHRTMNALRFLSLIIVHIFPLLQAGVLLNVFTPTYPAWAIYPVSIITSVLLITLFNIQENMEYAFDQRGFDDVKVEQFRLKLY